MGKDGSVAAVFRRHEAALTQTVEQALGRQVRLRRLAQSLTVAGLADAAGISSGMLSKIENGKTSPSLSTIQALARALQIEIASLFVDGG